MVGQSPAGAADGAPWGRITHREQGHEASRTKCLKSYTPKPRLSVPQTGGGCWGLASCQEAVLGRKAALAWGCCTTCGQPGCRCFHTHIWVGSVVRQAGSQVHPSPHGRTKTSSHLGTRDRPLGPSHKCVSWKGDPTPNTEAWGSGGPSDVRAQPAGSLRDQRRPQPSAHYPVSQGDITRAWQLASR